MHTEVLELLFIPGFFNNRLIGFEVVKNKVNLKS